ncbi:MAG TPA: hypothetical protein VFM25_04110 [Verrucomicrobiae bacterium]|nr:hypothetical protein [Verrucomicrobiae bacterium]
MPAPNVIQLRQLLKEKWPDSRFDAEQSPARRQNHWPTGLEFLDESLGGGLPKNALTEIVARPGAGGALLMNAFLRRAAEENQIIALVDGRDSFDVTQTEEWILSRLLWARCRSADEALKTADLILRDGNISTVLLDLAANPVAQLRKIPSTTWFRFQRIVEQTSAVCVVLTPQPLVSAARTRITLELSRRSIHALDRGAEELLAELKFEVSDARGSRRRHLANSA